MSSAARLQALNALKERRSASARAAEETTSEKRLSPQLAAPTRSPEPVANAASPSRPASQTGIQQKVVKAHAWLCNICQKECIPIRTESRCLCGHRLKEHGNVATCDSSKCKSGKCTCRSFFFVVAEGAWVLRCSCKHKHVEHDPVTHRCVKPGCSCEKFYSPWVCNCDHKWSDHKQVIVERVVESLASRMAGAELYDGDIAAEVNRWDLVQRGL